MDSAYFKVVSLRKRSLLQTIFKQYPLENAVIRLNNLLATKAILDIRIDEIKAIESQEGINLSTQFYLNLEEFYAVYYNCSIINGTVSDAAIRDLKHLRFVLGLTEKSILFIHSAIGEGVYKRSFEAAISDGRLDKKKEDLLSDLASRLDLPYGLTERISAEARKLFIKNYVDTIISDQRYTPEEERELNAIAASLKVDLKFDADMDSRLQQLKLFWALENLPLPVVQTDIILQKGEICHIQVPNVNWYESRIVRQKTGYTGYSTSIKIAKGFYLRSGSYTPHYYTSEQMKLIDYGTLYLTNKRILMVGHNKNSNIRLAKIINFAPYSDGVEIGKDTGKSPLLKISHGADIFCIILGRLLNSQV